MVDAYWALKSHVAKQRALTAHDVIVRISNRMTRELGKIATFMTPHMDISEYRGKPLASLRR